MPKAANLEEIRSWFNISTEHPTAVRLYRGWRTPFLGLYLHFSHVVHIAALAVWDLVNHNLTTCTKSEIRKENQ